MRLILGFMPEPWIDWLIRVTQDGWKAQHQMKKLSEPQASTLWHLIRKGGSESVPANYSNSTIDALVGRHLLLLQAASHENSPGGHMRPPRVYQIVTEAGRAALVEYIKSKRLAT